MCIYFIYSSLLFFLCLTCRVCSPSTKCTFTFSKELLCPLETVALHANKTHFMPLKRLFRVAWLAYSSCVGGLSLNFVDLI